MKSLYTSLFLLFIAFCSLKINGQNKITVSKIDIDKISNQIKYKGKIKNAITWKDKLGKNIVLTCETGEFATKKSENEGRDSEIYAYHYILSKNSIKENWKIYDFIKDCPVDIEASFIKNTLNITDLNKDGIAEIWVMYKTACHGDVSPCKMKIIMHQGKDKYTMRGENRVKISENEYYGGKYTFDKSFNKLPPVFREYAKKMWYKNINQKWE